jgi:2-phosphosulfolactate phosphatase
MSPPRQLLWQEGCSLRAVTLPVWQCGTPESFAGADVVVFDVLRATTTIACALAAGARAVLPVGSVDEARAARRRRPERVLAGEVHFHPPPDFDLGNSPNQYTRASVGGREVLLVTTNGTRALVAAQGARRLFAGALVNATAVAASLHPRRPLVLVASGTVGEPSLEDLVGAGAVLASLGDLGLDLDLDAWSRTALDLFRAVREDLASFLARTPNGQRLAAEGFAEDVRACARLDAWPVAAQVVRRRPLTLTAARDVQAILRPGRPPDPARRGAQAEVPP